MASMVLGLRQWCAILLNPVSLLGCQDSGRPLSLIQQPLRLVPNGRGNPKQLLGPRLEDLTSLQLLRCLLRVIHHARYAKVREKSVIIGTT
jgi:hypothetical protein